MILKNLTHMTSSPHRRFAPPVWACWLFLDGRSLTSEALCTHWFSAGALQGQIQRCHGPKASKGRCGQIWKIINEMHQQHNRWMHAFELTTKTSGSILCNLAKKKPRSARSVPAISTIPFWVKSTDKNSRGLVNALFHSEIQNKASFIW